MAITKSDMLTLLRLSSHPITSSVANRIKSSVRNPFPASLCIVNRPYSSSSCHVSAKKLDDEDFVEGLSSWNCIGSSHGWLGYINPRNLSFYLFKQSLINDPFYLPYIILQPIRFATDNPNAISKMVFSSSPSPIPRNTNNYTEINHSVIVVVTLDWIGPAAAFCRIGDFKWTTLANFPEESSSNNFQDIAYDSKHNLYYVVTDLGNIYSWKLSTSNSYSSALWNEVKCNFRYLAKLPLKKFDAGVLKSVEEIVKCKYYTVMDESSRSLLVIRLHIFYQGEQNYYNKVSRKDKLYMHLIDRLDLDRMEWFKVQDLVDTALFIGRNNGVVVDVRQSPGNLMPGHIYLACNADNFFQFTTLPLPESNNMDGVMYNDIMLRADMKLEEDEMTSFAVWNFG